jgi:hypothetical protein
LSRPKRDPLTHFKEELVAGRYPLSSPNRYHVRAATFFQLNERRSALERKYLHKRFGSVPCKQQQKKGMPTFLYQT